VLIAGVQGCDRLEQQQMNFLLGNGFVLNPAGNNKKFAFIKPNVT